MKEERTDGVQDAGKANESSAGSEQAADGAIQIDVAKKYHSKRRPDVEISGDELMAGFARGAKFDGLQSQFHTLEAADKAKGEQLTAATARVAQLESDNRLLQSYQNLGVPAVGKPPAEEEEWLGESGEKPNVNADIASRFEAVETEMKSRLLTPEQQEEIVKGETARLYAEEQGRQEAKQSRGRAATMIRDANLAQLKESMPDISEAALLSLVGAQDEFVGHVLGAVDMSMNGDEQGSIDTYMDGGDKMTAMIDKRVELKQQQNAITAERERLSELESFSLGSEASQDEEEVVESEFDPDKVEDKRKGLLAKAMNMMKRQDQLKNAAP